MKSKNLNDSLSHLHSELKKIKHVDKTSSELLNKLEADIRRVLENPGDVPKNHHKSLLASLEKSVEHFEASHPALTSLMTRIIASLDAMGI
jgi:uncharacterized protein YaaN involved in tellurite resistance